MFVQREKGGRLIAEWFDINLLNKNNMEIIKIETPKEGFRSIVQYRQQPVYFFRFDCQELEEDTILCSETTISLKDAVYEKMVSVCIEVKYSIDAQLALLYNYQLDPQNYQQQMDEYQQWRAYCKNACREFFGE